MAKYSVLFRFHLGRGYTQLSDEERTKLREHWPLLDVFAKWKKAGIKLKGAITCSSHPEGFAHHLIFEVDSLEQMREMDNDVFLGEASRYIEKLDFHIGSTGMEERWAEL